MLFSDTRTSCLNMFRVSLRNYILCNFVKLCSSYLGHCVNNIVFLNILIRLFFQVSLRVKSEPAGNCSGKLEHDWGLMYHNIQQEILNSIKQRGVH